jgi:tripeptide aminopeptidase
MTLDPADLLDRFCRYVRIDTRSDGRVLTTPSTAGQWELLRLLESELVDIGAREVLLTKEGYLLATIPPTSRRVGVPTLAWLAHVDTATELPGGAKPIVHRAYDGRPIVLPEDTTQVLTVETIPHLREAIGEDVITASGTTLLGADDKAGIAAIMATARHLLRHPEIPHGKIRICFNPDEEIGHGLRDLTMAKLGANVGYTLDGELRGEVDFETFSGDSAYLEFRGVAAHPGWAKGVLVNALRLAGRFVAALPVELAPERTSGREGFVHPIEIEGNSERAAVRLILRDFELEGLAAKRALVERLVAGLRAAEPRARINLSFREQYRNMRYWLERDMRPVELALEAVRRAGLEPFTTAIRGGTDGSQLTARGLPTPNLFCGMHEVHSLREWVTLQDLARAGEVLLHLAQLWEERSGA